MNNEYDYLFKAICVGDGGAGKTAVVIRFSQGFFQEQYKLTIGVEFAVKTIELVNGKKVKLQIWDTGGQERFQHVRPLYYRGSMGAILLFDLTNRESFDHIPKWIEEVRTNAGDIPMLLVGNKSDLTDKRQVSRAEAEEFSKEFEMYYIESSAKDGSGVGDVFSILSCLMIGIDVPPAYLEGTTLTDKNGKIVGQQMQFEKIEAIPELQELAEVKVPKLKSETIENEIEPEGPNFFSEKHLTKIEQPKPNIPSPSSEKGDSDYVLKTQQNSTTISPKKILTDEDLGIAPIPKKVKTPQNQQSGSEEWEIPSSNSLKIDKIASQQPSFSAPSLPSKEELDASIPAIPKRPAYLTNEGEGPITFDDSELENFTEETSKKFSAPPPLIFDSPDEIPEEELKSFSEPQPQSATMKENPPETQKKWPNFSEKPKAKPSAPPPGFFPRNMPTKEPAKPHIEKPVEQSNDLSNPIFSETQKNPLFNVEKKPQSSNAIPFSDMSLKETQAVDSMDNLLGALGSKNSPGKGKSPSSFKNFTPFSAEPSRNKPKPSFFIPEVKPKSQQKALNFYGAPPIPEKATNKKDKKDKKKDKKGKKQDIIICSNCGAILNSSYKFCNKCGSKL